MADFTNVSSIPDGVDFTEAQIKGFINQIDLNIFNILKQNKWNGADRTRFGDAGHKFDGAGHLQTLQKLRDSWEAKLAQLPVLLISQYDDPAL